MTIIILLINFFLIFLNIGILTDSKLKDILIKSLLVFSALIVFITELLSFFHLLNYQFVLLSWITISVFKAIYIYSQKDKLSNFITTKKQHIIKGIKESNTFDKFLSFTIIAFLSLVLIQGIAYPPNNWDSMTYHMARIPNWISHESVEHYSSHIFRQIYQPPFSEFLITHINILNYGDYLSNSAQLLFLIFSLFAILSILELLGLSRNIKLLAIVLTITIPEVILQASSTQNDIIVTFFILTSIHFAIKSIKEVLVKNYLFLGLSIGLGVLTKGTAYLYLAPILLIFSFLVLVKFYKTRNYNYLKYSIITALIFTSVNSGHYIRNYNLNNNILGIDKNESKMYSNENMSPTLLVSNIVKNAGLHIGPYPINKLSDKIIYKLHSITSIDINNSETNFLNLRYSGAPKIPNHEDTAPNPIHFFLIIVSIVMIGLNYKMNRITITLYLVMIILQVILFCTYLKWQPWHTRLHLPLFFLSIPLICYAISINKIYFKIIYKTIPVIILYAFFIIFFNQSRPFLTTGFTSEIHITDNRYKKYFSNQPHLYKEYLYVQHKLKNAKNIGLIINGDAWEYPLHYKYLDKKIVPVHIEVTNHTRKIKSRNLKLDYIISNIKKEKQIYYNKRNYQNTSPNNKYIWIYKRDF